jgi:RecJ-like exonuclease
MKNVFRRKKNQTEKCPVCEGKRLVNGEKCQSCGGLGYILVGEIQRNIAYNQNKNDVMNRQIHDVQISTVEGLSDTTAITVTGWNAEDAFKLFQKVRNEVKQK